MVAACLRGQETYQEPSLITSKQEHKGMRKEIGRKKRRGNERVRHKMREMDNNLTTKSIKRRGSLKLVSPDRTCFLSIKEKIMEFNE